MKHLEFRQKYSAASRIFNSLLSVSSPSHKRGPYASSDKVGKTLKAVLEKWARNEANAARTFLDSVRKIQKYSGHMIKCLLTQTYSPDVYLFIYCLSPNTEHFRPL